MASGLSGRYVGVRVLSIYGVDREGKGTGGGLGVAGAELEGPVNQAGGGCWGLLPGGRLWAEP